MVFARAVSSYMYPSTSRDRYRALLKSRVKVIHGSRFHTFASRALEAGIPIKVVNKLLGNPSIEITIDTYSHVLPKLQNDAVNMIAKYYEEMTQLN